MNLTRLRDYDKSRPRPTMWDLLRERRAATWGLPASVRTRTVAELVGVTPRTVNNWRTGVSLPQPRHARRLRLLHALLRQAGH
jgi:hypothetical protein